MTTRRIPKNKIRAGMAATGQSYQQALASIRAQVPDSHLLAPDDGPCVGLCLSGFLAADADGCDGGSMVDCAHCPGHVCVECGRASVDVALAHCRNCAEPLDK